MAKREVMNAMKFTKERFLKNLRMFYADTKRQIYPPFFSKPISCILLDHDKTMTYKADTENPMLSLFLHPWAAKILETGLRKRLGFTICSTAHISRLIRQYRDGINNRELLSRLIIIAEEGSVFAIPRLDSKLYYDLYETRHPPELDCARDVIEKVVNKFRKRNNLDVFLNKDLRGHITVENFERRREITDSLVKIIREALDKSGLLDKIWITTATYSIEANVSGFTKENVVELLQGVFDNGMIVSIGDSTSDVPAFKRSFGIQVPSRDKTIEEIQPLKFAKLIAIGSEGAGITTSQLLLHLISKEKIIQVEIEQIKSKLIDKLTRAGFEHTTKINPSTIRFDYKLPNKLTEKYQNIWERTTEMLKQKYTPLNFQR